MTAIVLVVEDEPDVLMLIGMLLRPAGYRVIGAASGGEAITALETEPPDVVVLDLRLGDMEGWDVLSAMRGRLGLPDVPVVIASAHASPSTLVRARDEGCAYISKPFRPRDLLVAVASALAA